MKGERKAAVDRPGASAAAVKYVRWPCGGREKGGEVE